MKIRNLTSLFLVVIFVILVFSGIILFIMPHGRVAYWTDWRFLNLNKDQWSELHIVFSLCFIIVGIFHILFNWKPLKHYLKKSYKELIFTLFISLFLIVGSIVNFTPFSLLKTYEEKIKNSWVDNQIAPKIPHGELWPLKKLIKKLNIPGKVALETLKNKGIKVNSPKEKIIDIAKRNNKKPIEIYNILISIKEKNE